MDEIDNLTKLVREVSADMKQVQTYLKRLTIKTDGLKSTSEGGLSKIRTDVIDFTRVMDQEFRTTRKEIRDIKLSM
jgi:hypothetical protein